MLRENRKATKEEIQLFIQAADKDCDQKISKVELLGILKLAFNST